MVSEKLCEKIREEGKKRGYRFGNSGNEYDENGNVIFVIRLIPTWTNDRYAKLTEPNFIRKAFDILAHLCYDFRSGC